MRVMARVREVGEVTLWPVYTMAVVGRPKVGH